MRRILLALLMAAAAGCQGLPTCVPLPGTDAARVVADILAEFRQERLGQPVADPAPMPQSYEVGGRRYTGDLYRLPDPPRAGLLLVPGAAPGGRLHPLLTAFARSLARARFAVMVPDVPDLARLSVSPGDSRLFADGVAYLATRPDLAPGGRIGVATFSYSVGPAILAALQPAVREKLRFILGVGGYHDIRAELVFATTGWYRAGQEWRHRKPNPYAILVFVLSVLDRLGSQTDRELLREIAERRVREPDADVAAQAARLGPEGRAVYDFAINRDRDRVEPLLKALPAAIQAELDQLDLANKDLGRLGATLILVHGENDDIVPHTHTLALARAAPDARAHILRGLDHVELRSRLLDAWTLYCAVSDLLAQRGPTVSR